MAGIETSLSKREKFSGRWGFILSCIGSSAGMGDIWRFPMLVSLYGGMTFLIPYFIFVTLIGSTGVIEEMALGRAFRSGPVGAFGGCTKKRWQRPEIGRMAGFVPVLGSFALAVGYMCVMAWIFKYTALSINSSLFEKGSDLSALASLFEKTAMDSTVWIITAAAVSTLIMSGGILKGIERLNKILMPLLLFLLIALAVYIFSFPSSRAGYKYIFTIDVKMLLNWNVWIFAFGQAFFSLSIAGNGTVIYGSYLSEKEDIPFAARATAFCDTAASLLAACVIIPAIALSGGKLDTGGPGLMFIHLVSVFNSMQGGALVGAFFFISVLFAGITSIINLFETPVAHVEEYFHLSRPIATLLVLIPGAVFSLSVQKSVAPWMDFLSIYICPLGAFMAGVMFLWILPKKDALAFVNEGALRKAGKFFYPLAKYVYVPLSFLALILGIIMGGIG